MFKHFYSRYGLALTMLNNNLETPDKVTSEMLVRELENGQEHFRLKPLLHEIKDGKVKFQYVGKSFLENNPKNIGSQGKFTEKLKEDLVEISYFLAPTVITSNKGAKNAWQGVSEIIESLKKTKKNIALVDAEAKMSVMPISGKINNGRQSQSNPRSSLFEVACAGITTFTDEKPAMLVGNAEPVCILPDLELRDLQRFIWIFKQMLKSQTNNLMLGKVKETKKDKENSKQISFNRPKICNGNFPFAPRQPLLGSAGLLGAIGRWARRANLSKEGSEVLESLKNRPIYIVKYGDASTVMYDEWVIELAKKDNLCDVIDSLERVEILSEEKQDYTSQKFQTFLLFASRFLQLFDEKSFQDFLATRAQYPKEIEKLFNTFFEKIMKKDEKLVRAARALGAWLNRVAYLAAKEEAKERAKAREERREKSDSDTLAKLNAKFLAEMESTVYSAKSHDALIAQVITRAGRLSFTNAPAEAIPFIDEIAAEKIELSEAKNLIVAYSRIKTTSKESSTSEPDEQQQTMEGDEDNKPNDETENETE